MSQYAVMCALEAEPGMSNARLARAAFVTAQAMQGVLANLERDGLVVRRPDPSHRRVLRATLTARGARQLKSAHEVVAPVEDMLVRSFGDSLAKRLPDALNRCAEDLALSRSDSDNKPRPIS